MEHREALGGGEEYDLDYDWGEHGAYAASKVAIHENPYVADVEGQVSAQMNMPQQAVLSFSTIVDAGHKADPPELPLPPYDQLNQVWARSEEVIESSTYPNGTPVILSGSIEAGWMTTGDGITGRLGFLDIPDVITVYFNSGLVSVDYYDGGGWQYVNLDPDNDAFVFTVHKEFEVGDQFEIDFEYEQQHYDENGSEWVGHAMDYWYLELGVSVVD